MAVPLCRAPIDRPGAQGKSSVPHRGIIAIAPPHAWPMKLGGRGQNTLSSEQYFIVAILLLINSLLAVAMLLAARTLGQPVLARLWAAAFSCNVLIYILNVVYLLYFRDNGWFYAGMSLVAMTGPVLATTAFRYRTCLPLRLERFITVLILATGVILYYSLIDLNKGWRSAVVPIVAAGTLLVGAFTMWRPGRTPAMGERPIFVTILSMALIEFVGGVCLILRGKNPDAVLDAAYQAIIFLGLPAMTVAAGVFTLYLMGGDLAERLRRMADTDPLTGAPNRRAIEAIGTHLIDQARLQGEPLALALCDLDHFKDINDRFGHALGDDVLRGLTRVFDDNLGVLGAHGRYGGEEFVLIFPASDIGTACISVERMRQQIMALRISGLPMAVTASFGLAAMEAGDTLASLIQRADQALYLSKEAGRNRTTTARPDAVPVQEMAISRA
jgi:diguanylate cyclase (GGDEF)-like protein